MLIQLRKNIALLWILRILAVPVVLVLFAAGFLLNLLYGVVGAFGGLLSLLGGVAAMLALLDAQPSSLRGGPGNPSVGINLDCSSFVQYCYWAQNLPFSAGSTAAYRNAADLVSISPSEVQPGDLRVVYASGGEQGHVQMALGGGAWIEGCYGYGVAVNMSNAWMESRPCYYFRYAGF